MTEAVKGNSEILAGQEAFKGACKRARAAFQAFDGVIGVGYGLKETADEFKDDIAITVFVREKKSDEALAPEERIPPAFEGYRTDVRVVRRGAAEACDNTTQYDKIQGGIQIMGKRTKTLNNQDAEYRGTLGCIVRKRQDTSRENVYLLTNKHVLFSPSLGAGQTVFHPTPKNESLGPVQDGGLYTLVSHPIGAPTDQQESFFVDCAIARIDLDSKCWGTTCTKDTTEVSEALVVDLQVNGVNSLADVRSLIGNVAILTSNERVYKVGRTTGRTVGRVVSVTGELIAEPEPDKTNQVAIIGLNTLEIMFDVTSTPNGLNCKGNARFTEQGDSGAIIVDDQNRVVGLHSHRDDSRPNGLVTAHACHILPVLDHLGICIPVTVGTSHGSSKATDGSGLLPAVNPAGDFPMPDGQIIFAGDAVDAASPFGLPGPVPVSSEEERRMRELLDAFRSTRKGRELHEFFRLYRREIGYLIRNHKLVKATWHRHKGPAFLVHVLNHLKGETASVPREVDGVSGIALLSRMAEVLKAYGSHPLREFIEEHYAEAMQLLTSGDVTSAQDCITWLQKREAAA